MIMKRGMGIFKSFYQDIYLFLPKAAESMKVPALIYHSNTQVKQQNKEMKRSIMIKNCVMKKNP